MVPVPAQVEAGEWDVLEALGDERFRGQGGGGRGRLDRGVLADDRLNMPLPWDHIDTGESAGAGKVGSRQAPFAVEPVVRREPGQCPHTHATSCADAQAHARISTPAFVLALALELAGIAKWWLKADLQRALEASTVPDCSHSGLCSECGVCEEDAGFGQNVVAVPPPVPEFQGHYK